MVKKCLYRLLIYHGHGFTFFFFPRSFDIYGFCMFHTFSLITFFFVSFHIIWKYKYAFNSRICMIMHFRIIERHFCILHMLSLFQMFGRLGIWARRFNVSEASKILPFWWRNAVYSGHNRWRQHIPSLRMHVSGVGSSGHLTTMMDRWNRHDDTPSGHDRLTGPLGLAETTRPTVMTARPDRWSLDILLLLRSDLACHRSIHDTFTLVFIAF